MQREAGAAALSRPLATASTGTSTAHQAPSPLHPHAEGPRTRLPSHPTARARGPCPSAEGSWLPAACQSSAAAARSLTPCRCGNHIRSGTGTAGCRFLPSSTAEITWGRQGPGQWENMAPGGKAASSPGISAQPRQRQQPSQLCGMVPALGAKAHGWVFQGRRGHGTLEPRDSSAVEGSLQPRCQHSPGTHEPACERRARGSDLRVPGAGSGQPAHPDSPARDTVAGSVPRCAGRSHVQWSQPLQRAGPVSLRRHLLLPACLAPCHHAGTGAGGRGSPTTAAPAQHPRAVG